MIKTAEFSADRKYRYALMRIWEPESTAPLLGLIGKNPSVADAERDDPTIGKEIALGKRLGCRGLLKLNMYDYIATDADELLKLSDSLRLSPEGMVSKLIHRLLEHGCKPVICCWGTHANRGLKDAILNRGDHIRRALVTAGIEPMCLKRNNDGTPAHPLHLPTNLEPRPY
jgi:hypothetical protein